MEFPAQGTLLFEPPPEEWRPFVRRKYKTYVK